MIQLLISFTKEQRLSLVWSLLHVPDWRSLSRIYDHDLIFITKKKGSVKRKQVSFLGRSYRNYDKISFQNYLRELDWDEFWLMDDPNECWGFIYRAITSKLDRMCPLKKRKVKQSNEPWLTNGILEAIFDKDQAWKLAKRTGDANDIIRAKRMRNDVKDIIRRAKKDFIQEELVRDETAAKKFWEKINHLLPNKDNGNTIRLIDKESEAVVEDTDLPDYINTFFTGIGPKLASRFNGNWTPDLPMYQGELMGPIQIGMQDIEKVVKDINVVKASSVPFISATVLKDAFMVIPLQLCYMYNLSFASGVFPEDWKIANVIPLKKGGDPTDVNNLRPVSLLPLPGKIAERLMHTHIANFVETNKLLSEKQGGFRKGRSTIATVAELTDVILGGLNNKEYTLASFIDLKKAFDTINHNILLMKLPFFGFNPTVIDWIQNYLTNRKQRCTVNGTTSGELDIRCGVPQGSILGPLLFLIYVNDVSANLMHTNVLLYADDTVIFARHTDERTAHLWVSADLNLLCNWCSKNQLTINLAKTKLMLFGTKNMLKHGSKFDIDLTGQRLQYVKQFNYLGMRLEDTLTFELHAAETMRMVAHKLYLLSRIRKYITIGQSIAIYKSKVVPYFDYGDIFLKNISQKTLDKLQKLQNRALRICLAQDGRSNVNDLHNTCNINKLEQRRDAHLLNFVYKRAHDEAYTQIGNRELRRFEAPVLKEVRSNNKSFEKSVLFQGAVIWNRQPVEDRNIATHKLFKRTQKIKLNALFPYGG